MSTSVGISFEWSFLLSYGAHRLVPLRFNGVWSGVDRIREHPVLRIVSKMAHFQFQCSRHFKKKKKKSSAKRGLALSVASPNLAEHSAPYRLADQNCKNYCCALLWSQQPQLCCIESTLKTLTPMYSTDAGDFGVKPPIAPPQSKRIQSKRIQSTQCHQTTSELPSCWFPDQAHFQRTTSAHSTIPQTTPTLSPSSSIYIA